MPGKLTRPITVVLALVVFAAIAPAQWSPQNGEWGKSEETDLRVMTWNVADNIASNNTNRTDGFNAWNALVRIVASLQPDILILQECGDGDGVQALEQVIDQFFNGGPGVTSYVTLFTPDYNLPHVLVSLATDGFNRNVILSRHPFADINGNGFSTYPNFVLLADKYQNGGTGGIRGFMFAEIDLPDDVYAGDIVVGNSHLKAFGDADSRAQRLAAAQNIAYFIDHYYNGARTGQVDPNQKVISPTRVGAQVLDENTPVVWGGDWNEDERNNGRRGPAAWMTQAQIPGGSDGTDRDGSDAVYDSAFHPISGDSSTQGGGTSTKLDYIAWQNSIATARRQFVFRSSGIGMSVDKLPEPLRSMPTQPMSASGLASDHRPVIVDLILPLAEPDPDPGCSPADLAPPFGVLDIFDVLEFLSLFEAQDEAADLAPPFGVWDIFDVLEFLSVFEQGCP